MSNSTNRQENNKTSNCISSFCSNRTARTPLSPQKNKIKRVSFADLNGKSNTLQRIKM